MNRIRRMSLLAGCVLAAGSAGVARADSISYVRTSDHNVYVANPDGSGARPLTSDGGYVSTSQADDGRVVAVKDRRLVVLDRAGHKLHTFDTVTTTMPNAPVRGPYDAEISPDGTKIAYWVGVTSAYFDPVTGIRFVSTGSFVLWVDANTGGHLGVTNYYETPAWLGDSSGALLWDDGGTISAQVVSATPGQNHNDVKRWFRDRETNVVDDKLHRIGDGEISRDGGRLAAVYSNDYVGNSILHDWGNHVAIYDVDAGTDTPPAMRPCLLTAVNGRTISAPQLSPDGNTVLWDQSEGGLWASDLGAGGCGTPRPVVADGSAPDWGPAAVGPGLAAPGSSAAPAPAPPAPQPGRAPAPKDAKTARPRLGATVTPRVAARSLRRGLVVRVACAAPCTAKVTVADGRRTVGRRTARVVRDQQAVRVKLSAKARARLGKRGHRTLTVKVAAAGTTVTRSVTVRR